MVVFQRATALHQIGHNVRVLGPTGWIRNRKTNFEFPVHRWPTLRGFFNEEIAYLSMRTDLALWKADVVHAHNTYPTGYLASRIPQRRIPLVITPHGADIQTIPEIGYGLRLDPALLGK